MFLREDRSPNGVAIREAIRATEQEIFAETMGTFEENLPGYASDDPDRELWEATEGWDGQPL
ncbi:MAG TPA: hypothetical protein VGI22_18725, partial [Xanthobacteraceae bacterium]